MEKFEIRSYFDEKFRGLEDSLKTDSIDSAIEFAYEKFIQGNYIEVKNWENGNYVRFNYDYETLTSDFENEDIYEDIKEEIENIM